jgi:MFS superfamily sulfate permease-like transporter
MALGLFSSALKFLPNATLAAVIVCALPPLIQVHKKTIMLWRSNSKSFNISRASFQLQLNDKKK